MRVAIIGGTGHIGSFLTPRLYDAGHSVVCISRGLKEPYLQHPAWQAIERVEIDRAAQEAAGNFGEHIAQLDAEVVIDLTCYRLESAQQLVVALRGRVEHLLHCGTIWVHGPSVEVPTTEVAPRTAFGDYGARKAAIEAYLLSVTAFPVTILHPGHLVGPGWAPINPAGNFNPEVFSRLLQGRPIQLPNIGMETVHHVHVDDVAQCFIRAMERRSEALGESFHVVSPAALTLRGYAERVGAVVRASGPAGVLTLGSVAAGSHGEGCRGDLGSHCPLTKLQHCQSTHSIGIRAALQFTPSGARVTHMAHRPRNSQTVVTRPSVMRIRRSAFPTPHRNECLRC